MKQFLFCFLLLLLLSTMNAAFANDSPVLTGVIAATDEEKITAPYAGEVISLLFREGDAVTAGMEAATMTPNIMRAPCSGTVTLFANQGDDAADVQLLYGALACIQPDASYRVAAAILTNNWLPQNQLVQPGETVYLRCTTDGVRSGQGVVTSVSGSSYSVLVTEGDFLLGEAVDIFRRVDGMDDNCIGTGTIARIDPVFCTGDGMVISEFVGNGDYVEAGDELYELAPTRDGHFVMHETSGVVAEVCVEEGDRVEAGDTIALVWPDEAMHVIIHVPEHLLDDYAWNAAVTLTFSDGRQTEGRISWVSMVPDGSEATCTWEAHIAFARDTTLRYGMRVEVRPVQEEYSTN
ncbi:MAG: HlyD family efflux transporter periplasmic adaptor subunit [Clostridia bacterium]|nr:HlyD family efflux transporter periplasmic adaptor subunit [Clostridia bacterium]